MALLCTNNVVVTVVLEYVALIVTEVGEATGKVEILKLALL